MEKVFKIIKDCDFSDKGRVFEKDGEYAGVTLYTSVISDDNSTSSITVDEDFLNYLNEEGYAEVIEQEDDCCCDCCKLEALEEKIDNMISTYEADYNDLMKEYEEGNVQQCVKVEAETVYHNLVKVLNNLKEFINE